MLRLGCAGCLTTLAFATVIVAVGWGLFQITRTPEGRPEPATLADSHQAQQKIFEVARRGRDGRARTTTLSERELSAFVRYSVAESPDLPLHNLTVRLLSNDRAEITGQIPARELLAMPPLSAVAAAMPRTWLDRPLWLTVRAHVTVEGATTGRGQRRLRLDVERFWLGRLRLPEILLRVLFDPATLRMLRWSLPDIIDTVNIEEGRALIRARP